MRRCVATILLRFQFNVNCNYSVKSASLVYIIMYVHEKNDVNNYYIIVIDVDECSEGSFGHEYCSQLCNNTNGSFNCYCMDGYELDALDYSTCHGIVNS